MRYFEIDYGDAGPAWRANGFHALDYGIELDVDDPAETWSAIWKMDGEVEALLLYAGPLVPHELVADAECASFDVAAEEPWTRCVGQTVLGAEFVEGVQYGTRTAPVTLVLTFDATEAVITLGTSEDDGSFRGSADDVAVFPSTDAARRAGALDG